MEIAKSIVWLTNEANLGEILKLIKKTHILIGVN